METHHPKCEEVMEDEKEESTEVKEEVIEDKKEEVIEDEKEKSMEVQEVMKDESTEVKKEVMEVKSTEVGNESMKSPKELKLSEEGEFVKLFDLLLELNRGELSDEAIAEGVDEARENFRGKISAACEKEIYNNPKSVCGFFHRYSRLFAGVTRNKFSVAFRYCEELRSCIHRLDREDDEKKLKIVDIGSGAGSALVGLYSAIASIYNLDFPFQYLKVTAIDYNPLWRKFFYDIEEKLRNGNFGNASKLFKEKDIECSFTEIDLLQDSCEKTKNKEDMMEADIILMKGFLTILKDDNERKAISRAVASGMKPGALLIVLESPSYEQYFQVESLKLVFTTRKYPDGRNDSSSSRFEDYDFSSQSVRIEFQVEDLKYARWEEYDSEKKGDKEDNYRLSSSAFTNYGCISSKSNQQIFVLKKLPNAERPHDKPDKKRKFDASI